MPVSKKALIRYQILNKLLQNSFGHTIKELTQKVNFEMEKLETDGEKTYTVSERMIRNDLQNIMDVYPIEIVKKGAKFYYEHSDDSINHINLRQEDKTAINLALGVFSRFKGTTLYDKFSDVVTRVIASSVLRKINTPDTRNVVYLAENPDNVGIEWIEPIYSAIVERKSIVLQYRSFGEKASRKIVSPYLLKEYRNIWFMVGYLHHPVDEKILTFKLSRIVDIDESDEPYQADRSFDAKKYFKHTLGVFHKHGEQPLDVKLKVKAKSLIILLSEDKIHPTQELVPISESECYLHLNVYDTPELDTLILGYGEQVEVLEPEHLRARIIHRIRLSQNYYP